MKESQQRGSKARFGKIVWWIGVLATGVLLATSGQGFLVKGDEHFFPHLVLALASALTIFFSHLWIVVYLRFLGRQVRAHQEEQGSGEREEIPGTNLWWSGAAILLVFGSFFLGPVGLMGNASLALHAGIGFLAILAQLMSLRGEKRDLSHSDEILARLFLAESEG